MSVKPLVRMEMEATPFLLLFIVNLAGEAEFITIRRGIANRTNRGAHVTNVRRLGLQAIESLCELVS